MSHSFNIHLSDLLWNVHIKVMLINTYNFFIKMFIFNLIFQFNKWQDLEQLIGTLRTEDLEQKT